MGINHFSVTKKCPCACFAMDGLTGEDEVDTVAGRNLTATTASGYYVKSDTGIVGETPLARLIDGPPTDYSATKLYRPNAERCFSIQVGGTAVGWFKCNGPISGAGPAFMSKSTNSMAGNSQISNPTWSAEWSLGVQWVSPTLMDPTDIGNSFIFNVFDGLGNVRTVNVYGSDFTPPLEIGLGFWFFIAARVTHDGVVKLTVGDVNGHIYHNDGSTYTDQRESDAEPIAFATPRAAEPTYGLWVVPLISFTAPTWFDEWSFYCCSLSDADIE